MQVVNEHVTKGVGLKGKMMKSRIERGIPYMLIAVTGIILLFRCFYSFSWSDESFYLTMVHRFWLGERMIEDEWYTAQLSTPLLLPFYAIFRWITHGNEGVYLYFRILYWLISTGTAFFTYSTLKKDNSSMASLLCSLTYLVYSRANIGGMSYYNMTLTCVLLAALLIYGQMDGKNTKWKSYLAGVFLAFAVVFTPFLALPYLVIAGALLICKKCHTFMRKMLWTFLGTLTVAIVYIGYVLSMVSIAGLMLNIPHILNEPELQRTNPLLAIPLIFIRIGWRYRWTVGIMACLIVYIFYKRKKGGKITSRVLAVLIVINLAVFLFNVWFSWGLIGCINIAGVLALGVLLFMLETWEKIDKKVFWIFGTAGFSMAVAFSLSSDTGLDAVAIGFVLIGMGGILLAFKLQDVKGIVMIIAWVMVLQTMVLRMFSIYRDAPIGDLKTQITSGPGKYLFTTQEHEKQYETLKDAIDEYVRKDDTVFYSKECFWSYLVTNNHYGAPSSWRMAFDSPRLEEYYTIYPQKIPTCVFIISPSYGNFESSLIQGNEKADRPNENNIEGYLADYIKKNDYEKIDLECATVYRKRNFLKVIEEEKK